MTALTIIRHEAGVALDAIAWRLAGRGWFDAPAYNRRPLASVAGANGWRARGVPTNRGHWAWAQSLARDLAASWQVGTAAVAPLAHLARRRALVAGAATAVTVITSAVSYSAWSLSTETMQLSQRMQMRPALSAEGITIGALPPREPLHDRMRDGRRVLRVSLGAPGRLADFERIAGEAEGRGLLGLDPINTTRAAVCRIAQATGMREVGWLPLAEGRCGGASTLLQQAVRTVDGDRSYAMGRKLHHMVATFGLALRLDEDAEWRFIGDHLFFGYAAGEQLIGVEAAARSTFGKPADALDLHETAWLVASLRYPLSLRCDGTAPDAEHQQNVRRRALHWLEQGFAGDPRLASARAALRSMPAPSAPVSDAIALELGFPARWACEAGASPLLRLARLAGPASQLAEAEAADIDGPGPLRLALQLDEQAQLVRASWQALQQIESGQRGHWHARPQEQLSFLLRTGGDGAITSAFRTSPLFRIDQPLEIGSLAKLYAAAFLAQQGWGARAFCNLSASLDGIVLHNNGGDPGMHSCTGRALMDARQVWGRSLSLPVYHALQQHSDASLRMWMVQHGVHLPLGQSAAYQLAFGLAQASPRDLAAFLSAYSAGVDGAPARGYLPHALATEVSLATTRPVIDLTQAFLTPGGRQLLRQAGSAALRYRGRGGAGTLAVISGGLPANAIAKSGTLDNDAGNVRFKGAAGGLAGNSWQVLMQPHAPGTALGDDAVSIIPIANVAAHGPMWRDGG